MNRKQKLIISITGITIVALALLGLTYGYYLTRIQGNTNTNSISVTTADLKLIYSDGSPNVVETEIEPSDEEYKKEFTVTNKGNVSIEYGVYLIDVINTFELKDDIKYTLLCTTDGNMTNYPCGKVDSETIFPSILSLLTTATIEPNKTHSYTFILTYKDSGENQSIDMNKKLQAKIQIFTKYKDGKFYPYEEGTLAYNIINSTNNASGVRTVLSDSKTKPAEFVSGVTSYKSIADEANYNSSMSNIGTYASEIWYYYDNYEIDTSTGKFTLSGKHSCTYNSTTTNNHGEIVNCYDDMENKYLFAISASSNVDASYHVEDSKTNLDFVYKVTSATTSTLSYVALYNSPIEAERVLASTLDDYGTSYYYRGDIQDNYVNFAGMCWRIVRIEGDGSIKLILDDFYTICNDTHDSDGVGTADFKYTGNWSNGNKLVFGYYSNPIGDRIDFLNFVGGLADSFQSFQTSLAKKINTNITDSSSQEEVNIALASKLKIDEWCYDDLTTDDSDFYSVYYGASSRIYINKNHSLICNGTKIKEFRDGTDMYVATLTADEIAYAGGKEGENNLNYYLLNNYSKNESNGLSFFTLSPQVYLRAVEVEYAYNLNRNGSLGGWAVEYYGSYSRPAVVLKSGTEIVSGNGTQSNPYIVS